MSRPRFDQETIVSALAELVRIESLSGREHGVIDWFIRRFEEAGVRWVQSGRNLLAWRGEGEKTLLFNSHMDTVPPGKSWTLDPFGAVRKDGKLHGLGANDSGGSLIGMWFALLSAEFDESLGRLMLAATCDEETQGEGFEKFVHEIPHFDACITGEPTNCNFAIAERGMFKLDLLTRGKSCHGARPWQGVNAAYLAARDILEIEKLFESLPERDELLGRATLAVTMVNGGVARNVVPGEVRWVIDGRTIPQLDNRALIDRVKAVLGEQTVIEQERARFDVWRRDPKDELIRCSQKANPEGEIIAFGGVSDAFWNQKAQGVILGPGHSHQSHQADEWIEEDELFRGYEIYRRTAECFLGGR